MWFPEELWLHIKNYIFDYHKIWLNKMMITHIFIKGLKPAKHRFSLVKTLNRNEHVWSISLLNVDMALVYQ